MSRRPFAIAELLVVCSDVIYMTGFWTVLADSGVSTKSLVVLLYQLIKNGLEVRNFFRFAV